MSIIPVSALSSADLARLGNNIRPAPRRKPAGRANRRVLAAVNRSLATLDERVGRLYPHRNDADSTAPVPVS